MIKLGILSISGVVLAGMLVGLSSCKKPGGGEAASNMGIGPIKEQLKLAAVDDAMAGEGKKLFEDKCSACHKIGERYVGPDLAHVTHRRQPEWIMNMILNPGEMTQKDPQAQELLAQFATQMTFQNVSQDEARKILEFFRKNDSGGK